MTEYTKAYIDINREILKKEFPWFECYVFPEFGAMFVGEIWDSQHNAKCQLRVVCGLGFPDLQPDVSIASPRVLPRTCGCPINELGLSHDYHCLGVNDVGEVRICHSASWDASITLLDPVSKAYLWWEGYQLHLRTGQSIDDFFNPN